MLFYITGGAPQAVPGTACVEANWTACVEVNYSSEVGFTNFLLHGEQRLSLEIVFLSFLSSL
jgi:hypothetical protein